MSMRKPLLIKKSAPDTIWSAWADEKCLRYNLSTTTKLVSAGEIHDVAIYRFIARPYDRGELYDAFMSSVPHEYGSDMLTVMEMPQRAVVYYCDSVSWEVPVGASRDEIWASRDTSGDGTKLSPWRNLCYALEQLKDIFDYSCVECFPLVKLVVTGIVDYPVTFTTTIFSYSYDFARRLLIDGANVDIRNYSRPGSSTVSMFNCVDNIYLANCTFAGLVGDNIRCLHAYSCTSYGMDIRGSAYKCRVTDAELCVRGDYCYECSGSSTSVSGEFFRGKYCVGCAVDVGVIDAHYVYGCSVDNGGIFADSLISESSVSFVADDFFADVGLYTDYCCHSSIDATLTYSANTNYSSSARWGVSDGSCGVTVHFDITDDRDSSTMGGEEWLTSDFKRDCTIEGRYRYTGNSTRNLYFYAFDLDYGGELPYNCTASISYSGGYGRATLLPLTYSDGTTVHGNELHWCNIYGDKPDAVCIGAEAKRVDCSYPEYVVERISFCEFYKRVINLEVT